MSGPVNTVRLRSGSGLVAMGTMLSRILGLARDVVTAAVFGATGGTDAFFVAFRIPNTLRNMLAEGGVTVAVQPLYHEAVRDGNEARRRFEQGLFSATVCVLVPLTATVALAAPWLIRAFAGGFPVDGEPYAAAVLELRVLAPYVLFMGLVGAGMGVLNALGRFAAPAFGPVVANVGLIVGSLWLTPLVPSGWPETTSLAWGAMLGIVGWWALQDAAMRRAGVTVRYAPTALDPRVLEVARLLVPSVAGLAVYQLQVVIGTQFASRLAAGGVSALYYADRVNQFPLGVIATSVGTVALPLLTRARNAGEPVGRVLGEAVSWVFFLVFPAWVGIVVLRDDIVAALFRRGVFDAVAAARTSSALAGYALALLPASLNRVLLPAFYSRKDMRSPVVAGAAALLVQATLSWLWFNHDVLGLATATAVGSLFQSAVLWMMLAKRGEAPRLPLGTVARSAVAAAAAGIAALVVVPIVAGSATVRLAFGMAALGAVFVGTAMLLRHAEMGRLVAMIKNRARHV